MTPKLTPEMRAALQAHQARPIEVEDDQTQRVYILVERGRARDLLDRWIADELDLAEADVAAGRVVPWDKDGLLSRARAGCFARR